MASLLLVGLAAGSPHPTGSDPAAVHQEVDLIELNHFVDGDGREVFRQVIFYDWSNQHHRFHVRAWRLIKNENQVPKRRWNPDCHQCTWHDNGLLRQVSAPKMRETWTQQDPERVNRKLLPEDQRIPLFPIRTASQRQSENR
ncbi:hypothetical protein K227x_17520 [Rubripirellula lacrimiformis]|uniref:Uncharacterized protein n=2 Tax=Rubripirellula lacrimiformis TaxID=1930273 RepID=A0A517N8B8_9BACT|nr:hypothetical protein K227x_17520 [Rubripirellula lacrimiformis]